MYVRRTMYITGEFISNGIVNYLAAFLVLACVVPD